MKLFHLYRIQDESGVSGTGPVVEGVEFTNGWCAIRWLSKKSTVCFYQSIHDVRSIHGHGGKTELVIHDFEPARKSIKSTQQFELFLQTLEEISEVVNSVERPETTPESVHASIAEIKRHLDTLEVSLLRRIKKAA